VTMPADMLTIARWLVHERGFSVIPLDHPAETTQTDPKRIGKVPVLPSWKAFQTARPTDDNLQAWFGNGRRRNIAIVTGAVSGLVVVDCDSPEAIAWADRNLPPTPLGTRTAKGQHRGYRHPGVPVRNKARIRTDNLAVKIDIRGDGGFVVAPGSLHQTGVMYERIGEWPSLDELPVFDPSWLETESAEAATGETRQVRRAHERADRKDRKHLIHRARAYLAATPPAIEGQGGDAHTYQVVCRIVRGFDLADADALDLLRDWNQRCVPPWTDAELSAKIEGARKYGNEAIGARRDGPPRDRSPRAARSRPFPTAGIPAMEPEALQPADAPRNFNLTDSGNAEYFAARQGQDVRYDHRRGRWLLWRRHRWQPDADAKIRRLAKAAIRRRFKDAAALDDPQERTRAAKWAIASESRSRLDAALYLAQAEHPIAESGAHWDTDAYLLGVPNGVIDLRTGTLRLGRREDRTTMQTAVAYDPNATCPRWERFVSEIFADDASLIRFVHRAVGYSLTGDTSEQCLFLLYGTGANGKGTFANTLKRALGDYAWNMPFVSIEMRDRSAIPNDMAALFNRRFVIASETNDGARLNEARLKALTGCDPITARFLHQEFFEFEPVAKFWLSVNHKPIVRDDSYGFWRRIRLVPFMQTFAVNKALADELHAEAAGILAWAMRGCLAFRQQGLDPPPVVSKATAEYERDSDPLAGFLDEACDRDAHAEVSGSELYEHYKRWADRDGLSERERLTATKFGTKVSERFEREHRRSGSVYKGIARRPL
jgi:putative DNA primase/helicase